MDSELIPSGDLLRKETGYKTKINASFGESRMID
jgi:hypothetical protein